MYFLFFLDKLYFLISNLAYNTEDSRNKMITVWTKSDDRVYLNTVIM